MEAATNSQPQDIAVRERLLKAAMELFARKGYAATTTREIVAAARVTKPVLYYYFRNKEGIFLELMREAALKFEAIIDQSRAEKGSARKRLLQLYDQAFALIVERIEVARVMQSIYYGPPQGAPFVDFDAFHFKFQEAIKDLVEEGIRKGEFRKGKVGDMVWAILGVFDVTVETQLCHPEIGPGRVGLARILNLIFRGISADGEGNQ
jgi:AcrR family transcriptional regulator